MAKVRKANRNNVNNLIPIFMLIATLFMSIGYASINNILLEINGSVTAKAQDGVFITNVDTNEDLNAKVDYYGTLLHSVITLPTENDTDGNSPSITYEITVYNSTNFPLIYQGTVTDSSEEHFYSNPNIEFKVDGINAGDEITTEKTFTITFYYKDNVIVDNNILESYIKFLFESPKGQYASDKIKEQEDGVTLVLHDGSYKDTNGNILDANDGSYRYVGTDPNNYICFGATKQDCLEDDNNLYRIIGVYGDNLKIVKSTSLTSSPWNGTDLSSTTANTVLIDETIYYNYWEYNGIKATLNEELNGSLFYDTLEQKWKNMIVDYEWNIGGQSTILSTAKAYYSAEIETKTVSKIGLITPSEYGFAAPSNYWKTTLDSYGNAAYKTDWLNMSTHQWTITRNATSVEQVLYIYSSGNVYYFNVYNTNRSVRPSFYLNSNVKIVGGEGSKDNPYILEQPYLPEGFTHVADTTLDTGYVIEDPLGNEYVWIEVPQTSEVYTTTGLGITNFTEEVYDSIYEDLRQYTMLYRKQGGTTETNFKDEYHSGCGIASEEEYNTLKSKMLKSIYENGGFYIGRYETGTMTARTNKNDMITSAVVKQNVYPYNFVTNAQAQEIATGMYSGDHTSSLMFGLQWDLVLRFLELNGVDKKDMIPTSNGGNGSKNWGNYSNSIYNITNENAKYFETSWVIAPYGEKNSSGNIILSTGADAQFSKQGIYDLAGNVREWTLEYTNNSSAPCAASGGSFNGTGGVNPVSYSVVNDTTVSTNYSGFRISIY